MSGLLFPADDCVVKQGLECAYDHRLPRGTCIGMYAKGGKIVESKVKRSLDRSLQPVMRLLEAEKVEDQ